MFIDLIVMLLLFVVLI